MKTKTNLFKKMSLAAAVITIIAIGSGCSKKSDTPTPKANYTVSGNASGAQEVPPVSNTATGSIAGTFNPNNNQFIFTTTWVGLSGAPVSGGFYNGATGTNGTLSGDLWVFPAGVTGSGSLTDTLTLTSDQATQLTSGSLYYSYGTTLNPTGEIRGQITATR